MSSNFCYSNFIRPLGPGMGFEGRLYFSQPPLIKTVQTHSSAFSFPSLTKAR